MKKTFAKALKLEIKPVFQFSSGETKGRDYSDTTTTTLQTVTHSPGKRESR